MQAANAAAPAIVAAIKLLAEADQQHVAFAMVGLRSRKLVEAAQAAARQLQPVAERLVMVAASERVAAELREEMIAVHAASVSTEALAADWGELLSDLVPRILTALPGCDEPAYLAGVDAMCQGHVPMLFARRYAASGMLAKVNRCWAGAMSEWRRLQRQVVLVAPDSAAVRMVARDSPAVEELYLYPRLQDYVLAMEDSDLRALHACSALRRLCMPRFDNLSKGALVELLTSDQLLRLVEVDVSGSYLDEATCDALLDDVWSKPHVACLRLRVNESDALWERSAGKPTRARLSVRSPDDASYLRKLPFGPVYYEDWDPDGSPRVTTLWERVGMIEGAL